MDVNKFLGNVYELICEEKIEKAVDVIFDQMQYLMDTGNQDLCDTIIGHAEPEKLQTETIVAFLTTTRHLHSPNKQVFIEKSIARVAKIKGAAYGEEILKKFV